MALGDPWGSDGNTYDGGDMRRQIDAVWQQTGVVDDNDFLVEQQTSPNTTVKVRAGSIIVSATGSGLGGKYSIPNDASLNSPAFTATSTNGRKDRLILRVTAGSPSTVALEIVQGTASASPAEPSITGDNYEELALITLPGSTTNITTAMITDRRNHATARGSALRARGTSYARPLYSARARATSWTMPGSGSGVSIIPFDTEDYDPNGNFTTGASANYNVPVAGVYRISASVGFNYNGATAMSRIWVYKNGSPIMPGNDVQQVGAGSVGYHLGVGGDLELAAGDVIGIRVVQGSGNSATGATDSFVSIHKL